MWKYHLPNIIKINERLINNMKQNVFRQETLPTMTYQALNKKQLKHLCTECKTIRRIFAKSLNISVQSVSQQLDFSMLTRTLQYSGGKEKKIKPTGAKEPGGQSGNNNSDENKNDNDDKIKSFITKTIIWIFIVYMLGVFISLVTSSRGERPEGSTRYVSWNEFVYHMLAAGEVKEVIIRPDMEMVTIILHEGAIIKGKKVSSTIFHMAVADAAKFEEKLRDIEKRLGIKEGS
uniref:Peptidase M41 FtsH extracellular domain-containing protein n=1 Tax=Glossina palpalis gambiensis TaxID=67801 RepID=A0A1B0BXX0_9MUSC